MTNHETSASVILFVDDEVNILNSLKRELHDWARESVLTIETAPSAREGLKRVEAGPESIAVIVSDLKMPEMKGSDFLLEVKRRWPDIVTILLTGFSETQEVMKAVQAGISSYILKPWESDYLRAELDKAVASRRMRLENAMYAKTLEEELRWAGEMQRALLKPAPLKVEGIEFRTSYRPVKGLYCGGDYYDVIALGGERYLMLLGDVAGHGVKAAFVTGILKAIIFPEYVRNQIGKKFSPAGFLSWLNDRMNFELRQTSDLLVTFFAGVIDRATMTFTYANAGQGHPFIVSKGLPRELPVSGSALGFAQSTMYSEKSELLSGGDVIVTYTDGLVEAGAHNGEAALLPLGEILAAEPYGADYHKRILEQALKRSACGDFEDDVTIVTARIE
ncbi:MAG TPA: SpoIIE family protein phosphatase [Rectinemataceae bacterium]|nr:SpoIIE family protein phosphatase [Rectinemataceae bacterium]